MSDRRDLAWGIEFPAPERIEQNWWAAHASWVEACLQPGSPDEQCSLCGSYAPAVTKGWPVCANRYFHEDRLTGWAAYRYRGAHRPGPGRRSVEEIEVELRPKVGPEAIYLGSQTFPFKFYGIAPDPTPEVITATMTFEPDPLWVLGVPALFGPMPPQPVLTFEDGLLLADGQPISLFADADSTGSASVPAGAFNPALGLGLRPARLEEADCSGSGCPDLWEDR